MLLVNNVSIKLTNHFLPLWIEITVISLAMLSLLLIPIALITLLFKLAFHCIKYINALTDHLHEIFKCSNKDEEVNFKKIRILALKMLSNIIFIMLFPVFIFTLIYGIAISFTELYKSNFSISLFNKEYFYLALDISYPSSSNTNDVQDNIFNRGNYSWANLIMTVQVIFQKLIEIFVLGYVVSAIVKVIETIPNKKNLDGND